MSSSFWSSTARRCRSRSHRGFPGRVIVTCANSGFTHRGRPYRVLYAFDPRRAAILLLGGDKTGNNRWYDENIPVADDRYDDYLRELKKEGLI